MSTRTKFNPLAALFMLTCVLLMSIVGSVSAQVQPAQCFDAAGGVIPCTPTVTPPLVPGVDSDGDGFPDATDRCPAQSGIGAPGLGDCPDPDGDFITNDGDLCPDQPGPAETGGCPVASTDATPLPPTLAPSTESANPLRPPSDGLCQVAAATSTPSNVRAEPSLNAAIVSSLQINQLYAVLGTVVNAEGTWYRVETGWVSSIAVNIGGQCPARVIAAGPSGFSIPQEAYDQATAGIIPEEQCTTLFNGIRLCQIVLTASADDGGATEGLYHWGTTTCGFGPGGVVCILNEFSGYAPDECPPEFCEPSPIPNPAPGYNPSDPEHNGSNGQVYCKTLINDLTLPAGDDGPYYTIYQPDGSVGFGLRLPPTDPQPCLIDVYLVREDGAANGLMPVDRITLETEFPQPTGAGFDYYLRLDGVDGESSNDGRPSTGPSITVFDLARFDLRGNVCIPVTHGNFAACPGEPIVPTDLAAAPTAEVVDPIAELDRLISTVPDGSDPTGYICQGGGGDIACYCLGNEDCFDLASNVCANEEIYCEGDVCGCLFEDTPN